MGMRIWDSHKPPPSSAGAWFSSPPHPTALQTRSTAQHIDQGRLYHIRASPVAKQVERHHFLCLHFAACFAARNSYSFQHFRLSNFSILPTDGMPSINIDIFFRHPDTCRRSPWTIRYTGGLIHKWFMWLLLLMSLPPNPDF